MELNPLHVAHHPRRIEARRSRRRLLIHHRHQDRHRGHLDQRTHRRIPELCTVDDRVEVP